MSAVSVFPPIFLASIFQIRAANVCYECNYEACRPPYRKMECEDPNSYCYTQRIRTLDGSTYLFKGCDPNENICDVDPQFALCVKCDTDLCNTENPKFLNGTENEDFYKEYDEKYSTNSTSTLLTKPERRIIRRLLFFCASLDILIFVIMIIVYNRKD